MSAKAIMERVFEVKRAQDISDPYYSQFVTCKQCTTCDAFEYYPGWGSFCRKLQPENGAFRAWVDVVYTKRCKGDFWEPIRPQSVQSSFPTF